MWHRQVTERAGAYTANRAKSHPEVDPGAGRGGLRRPRAVHAGRPRPRPAEDEEGHPDARPDRRDHRGGAARPERGIYYAFPFLAGTRPSEQLGLLWEDVDFDAGVIRIRRIQERDGSLTAMTKTEAGTREIPMGRDAARDAAGVARALPAACTANCTRVPGSRPAGALAEAAHRRRWAAALSELRARRYWAPVFKKLGLPYVTPHSARHSYISTMQAQGSRSGPWRSSRATHGGRDARPLHASGQRRGGRSGGAGEGVSSRIYGLTGSILPFFRPLYQYLRRERSNMRRVVLTCVGHIPISGRNAKCRRISEKYSWMPRSTGPLRVYPRSTRSSGELAEARTNRALEAISTDRKSLQSAALRVHRRRSTQDNQGAQRRGGRDRHQIHWAAREAGQQI